MHNQLQNLVPVVAYNVAYSHSQARQYLEALLICFYNRRYGLRPTDPRCFTLAHLLLYLQLF